MVRCTYWIHLNHRKLYGPMGEVVEEPGAGKWDERVGWKGVGGVGKGEFC